MKFHSVIVLVLLQSQSSVSYYRHYSLHKLCAPDKTTSIVDTVSDTVQHNKDIVTIDIYDSPTMTSVLVDHAWDDLSYKNFHHCEFNVKTRSKWSTGASSGLFVAIRELKFRQNIVGECIDYMIIELDTMTTPTSHKICGSSFGDESVLDVKNYFEASEGFVKIVIHIDPQNLKPNELSMKLTITAFEDCNGSYGFHCTTSRCISESLYDDLIINCIPPFCADEPTYYSKCGTQPTYMSPNTHVILIGTTLMLMIFGIGVAWYFLKFYVFCYRYYESRVNGIEEVALNTVVEYEPVYVPPGNDSGQSSTDAPPSYDSLFE